LGDHGWGALVQVREALSVEEWGGVPGRRRFWRMGPDAISFWLALGILGILVMKFWEW